MRSAARDLAVPQESFVLAPQQLRSEQEAPRGRLVVTQSPSLQAGTVLDAGAVPLSFGRAAENSVALDGDGFASARHARIESQRDGIWILDLGSTNGTWVNGERMDGRQRLHDGDVVRIGETELRFEG